MDIEMKEHKTIVAGGRDFNNYGELHDIVFTYAERLGEALGLSIVSGLARGADAGAVRLAHEYDIVLHEFPANWAEHGRSAGFKRNTEMAHYSDALIAFWDGKSSGTKHMIETMQKLRKPVEIIEYYVDQQGVAQVIPF